MLRKIFTSKRGPVQPRALVKPARPAEKWSRVVKIVHAGGHVECYYMAVPAQRIIEKYPSFILARPEIFRRPWDSIVRPDEILVPGQKYYIIPHKTVEKLKQRIKKDRHSGFSYESKSWAKSSSSWKDSLSISGILVKSRPKVKARDLHVSFSDIEITSSKSGFDQTSTFSNKNNQSKGKIDSKEKRKIHIKGKHARPPKESAWEPSLNSIIE